VIELVAVNHTDIQCQMQQLI